MKLPIGLYDQVLTDEVWQSLLESTGENDRTTRPLSSGEASIRLADAIASQLVQILDDVNAPGPERTQRKLEMANAILAAARQLAPESSDAIQTVRAPAELLLAVHTQSPTPPLPDTGLALPWLFTAGRGSPSLLSELRRELQSADQVDILVSFITRSGIRKIADALQLITAIGGNGYPRTRLRVLTTTYTGATEIEALDELARLSGCEVKVSLDGRRTRLHAKAWLFHRRTGFGSAYVGSANLSGAALMGGMEWTVKLTERNQSELFGHAKAHFETLWEDSEFQLYNPNDPTHRTALRDALKREGGTDFIAQRTFFELTPKPYQQEMLTRLQTERELGRNRNLIVAATGTGKTVIAAFDYERACQLHGGRPRILFVAHREEILKQALRTYREVLQDSSFAEYLGAGTAPQSYDHLFATIDSVCSRDLVSHLGADYWHTVVVDECHRMAANRLDSFAKSVSPNILLGLTATPERSDGKSILGYFDSRPDGSPAVELRLWHALDLQLLSPFEYYACDDDTDFSAVPWDQPGEGRALDRLVADNHTRAKLVLREWRRLAKDPVSGRALVFCVSVAHAEFMAKYLNEAGVKALCVVGTTSPEERRNAPELLARGEVSALVTCDLYNEGIDIPGVDTLLLLRPTQSPVLFQQQIGRGLRLSKGKDICLILDFVGRHRQDFRFDRLLSSVTGLTRSQLLDAAANGFSNLPPGCHIHLQRQSRDQVLASIRRLVEQNWNHLTRELQAYASITGRTSVRLAAFLHDQAIDINEIYRGTGRSGWTNLKRSAGLVAAPANARDAYLGRRYSDLLHIDDGERLQFLRRVGEQGSIYEPKDERERRLAQMLAYQVEALHDQVGSGEDFLNRISENANHQSELAEISEVLQSRDPVPQQPIPGLEDLPLSLYAAYGIREILTAVGWLNSQRRIPFQAGVLALKDRRVELLFVTLDKREGYHERIAYHDYAISPERFHWQSQNATGPDTEAGRRYGESPGNGWSFQLFVRKTRDTPYRACGPVTLESTEGAKPMTVYWKLVRPLPLRLFQEFSILRAD